MPKISVIMPVYNSIEYLDESIQSILNQTEKDFEFIIIDDGSVEPIFEKIKSYKDNRIVSIRREDNKGLTFRLNDCLDIVKGDFIARMDGDDISLPERFERQLKYFESGVGFVGCWGRSIDTSGELIIHYVDTNCRCSNEDLKNVYPHRHCMIDSSVVYTRQAFDKIGYYDLFVYNAQSYNYYRRIQQFFEYRICPEILYIRRVGSGTDRRNDKINTITLANERVLESPIIKRRV